jgi:hypothetical protein
VLLGDVCRCCLQDDDPYVRKTAAVCVAKLFDINPELVEDRGFLDMLRVRSSRQLAALKPTCSSNRRQAKAAPSRSSTCNSRGTCRVTQPWNSSSRGEQQAGN